MEVMRWYGEVREAVSREDKRCKHSRRILKQEQKAM
jgi:hypothetical protein